MDLQSVLHANPHAHPPKASQGVDAPAASGSRDTSSSKMPSSTITTRICSRCSKSMSAEDTATSFKQCSACRESSKIAARRFKQTQKRAIMKKDIEVMRNLLVSRGQSTAWVDELEIRAGISARAEQANPTKEKKKRKRQRRDGPGVSIKSKVKATKVSHISVAKPQAEAKEDRSEHARREWQTEQDMIRGIERVVQDVRGSATRKVQFDGSFAIIADPAISHARRVEIVYRSLKSTLTTGWMVREVHEVEICSRLYACTCSGDVPDIGQKGFTAAAAKASQSSVCKGIVTIWARSMPNDLSDWAHLRNVGIQGEQVGVMIMHSA